MPGVGGGGSGVRGVGRVGQGASYRVIEFCETVGYSILCDRRWLHQRTRFDNEYGSSIIEIVDLVNKVYCEILRGISMTLTHKQRLLTALRGGIPDRLPVTTHHLMAYFRDKYMDGMPNQAVFEIFDMDGLTWVAPHRPDLAAGEYHDPLQGEPGFLESRRIVTDSWRV